MVKKVAVRSYGTSTDIDPAHLTAWLGDFGEEGWELVTAFPGVTGDQEPRELVVFFKRQR